MCQQPTLNGTGRLPGDYARGFLFGGDRRDGAFGKAGGFVGEDGCLVMMKRLEWAFHVIVLSLQCGAFMPLILHSGNSVDMGESNPINTITNAVVLLSVLTLTLAHARTTFRYLPALWLILGLLALALISAFWSDYPGITVRRTGSLGTAAIWAWYLAARYDLKDVVKLLAQTFAILALASLFIALALPSYGRADPLGPDGWRGAFGGKNELGAAMAVGAATFIYLLTAGERRFSSVLWWVAGLVVCLGLLYLSQSRTSWLVALLALPICQINKLMHGRVGVGIIIWTTFILIVAPAMLLVVEELPAITGLLGRDSTLTGRADIWATLPQFISERPWLGYGYGGFWVAASPRVNFIQSAVGWLAPHSHNGWLDLLLDLGIVGVTIVAVQILLILVKGVRAVIDGREPHMQFILLLGFILLINNFAESELIRPGVGWVSLVISAVAIGRISAARRLERRQLRDARLAEARMRERFGFGPSVIANR
jgi:exopolysaccharide production protein ExoQ